MLNTVAQHLSSIQDSFMRKALQFIVPALADRFSSQAVSSAGLVIKAASNVLAKTGASATHLVVDGKPVQIAAATDMPSLTGVVITANWFNVVCFFVDAAGTLSMKAGQQASTRVNVKFPQFPAKQALVGYLIITHSSTFTGGTTALDTATTQYVSPTGAFDPTIALG